MTDQNGRAPGFGEAPRVQLVPDTESQIFLSAPHMGGGERTYVNEAFDSNYIAPVGPMLTRFEARLAPATGFKSVVALTSGTAGLHLALRIAGVQAGDEVWAPTLTFIGGIAPIQYLGATPVFFDADDCGLIDLDLVEAHLKSAARPPKALITADLYGNAVDIARARKLCAAHGITLISDSAESLGATFANRPAGAGAHFAIYSFNGNKIITTSGGGALATELETHAEQARFLSTQARDPAPHYEHTTYGYNYRLSNICAAIGVGQLEVLADRVATRRSICEFYQAALSDLPGVSFLPEPKGGMANRWLTVMLLSPGAKLKPMELINGLAKQKIEARPVWKPMHLQPLYKDAPVVGGKKSEQLFATGLCLPSGSNMSSDDLERIVAAIKRQLA